MPPPFYNDLDASLATAWHLIETGVHDRQVPAHTPTLANVAADGAPALRTVVLREADRAAGWVQIHTDRRARKAADLARNPRAALHIYDPAQKIQVRLGGRAVLHLDDAVADAAWAASRHFSRECYRVTPGPGAMLDVPGGQALPPSDDPEAGRESFAAVRLHLDEIEWLYLAAAGHRRAVFTRAAEEGGAWTGQWLAP